MFNIDRDETTTVNLELGSTGACTITVDGTGAMVATTCVKK